MTEVDAIYEAGVFKPLTAVHLKERQHVRLKVQAVMPAEFEAWWQEVQRVRAQIEQRVGVLPDSTPEIAEDRMRDV